MPRHHGSFFIRFPASRALAEHLFEISAISGLSNHGIEQRLVKEKRNDPDTDNTILVSPHPAIAIRNDHSRKRITRSHKRQLLTRRLTRIIHAIGRLDIDFFSSSGISVGLSSSGAFPLCTQMPSANTAYAEGICVLHTAMKGERRPTLMPEASIFFHNRPSD